MLWKGVVIPALGENISNDPTVKIFLDVRKRLRNIRYQAKQLGNEDQMDKAAKYHNWVALPLWSVITLQNQRWSTSQTQSTVLRCPLLC